MISSVVTGNYGVKSGSELYMPETLGKEEFLRLLTMQLRYQNPLEPMENTEFIAQLTEFSSLEQLQNIDTNIESQMLLTQATNNSLATSLIGKYVKSSGNSFSLGADKVGTIYFHMASDADATIKVYDSNNVLVATLVEEDLENGINLVEWDGKKSDQTACAPGVYTFEVSATDSAGASVDVTTYTCGMVEGVKFVNGNAVLLMEGFEVNISTVLEVLSESFFEPDRESDNSSDDRI
jgi:flagellar basal-body rod modification protein FlgD